MTSTRFARRAEWIWRPRDLRQLGFNNASPPYADEENLYVYFRKTIEIEQPPSSCSIHVSADARYQLFVNGHFVGRGPSRCSPQWQSLDQHDIGPFLSSGRNVVAALVHSFGRHTAGYELPGWEQGRAFGCGGFFLQGEIDNLILDTHDEWRCLVSSAWEKETPFGSLGFMEYYDARREPVGWTAPNFDDSAWETAQVLRTPGRNTTAEVRPFPVLVPRTIPPMAETIRLPQAIISQGEIVNSSDELTVAERFSRETIQPSHVCSVHDVETLLNAEGHAEIRTTADRGISIVVDFGEIIAGYVNMDLEGPAGAVVEITYGERLDENGGVLLADGIPGFDARPGHRYTLREGRQRWGRFAWNGFRYLQITVRNCPTPLQLYALAARFTSYPVEGRGRFACSDDQLNRIREACRYTAQLCMHDGYIDCPSREQRQWVGDSYIQSLLTYAAFGDSRLIEQFLRQAAQSQRANGLTAMAAPGDFSATAFTNIPDFTLHWIMAVNAYYRYTGNLELVAELYPSMVKALGWFEQFVDTDDLLNEVPHWLFIDWAELDKTGQVTALNAHFVTALRSVAKLARLLGVQRDAVRFDELAEGISQAINVHLWDPDRGVYVDARHQGTPSRRVSQQTNAEVICFGVAPWERWESILDFVMDEKRLVLTRGIGAQHLLPPAFDEERNVVLAQPFAMHFVHRALSMVDRHQTMLDNIRKRWGAILDAGSNTVWETWALTPITSLCHASSATPLFDLSTEILGVTPMAPGFQHMRIAPQPADLSWAEGAFPTPHGEVGVRWVRDNDSFDLMIEVPAGIKATVVLPDGSTHQSGPGIHDYQC